MVDQTARNNALDPWSLAYTCRLGIVLLLTVINLASCSDEENKLEALEEGLPERVDYNYHVRPILSDRCFSCHGPDEAARQAALRLDNTAAAYAVLESGARAIRPGKLRQSEVWRRINSTDPDLVMPPPESKLSLSEEEKALIGKWIRQGAEYKEHWAFLPVRAPSVPLVSDPEACFNAVDHFILATLEQSGLTFSPEADKETLLRRVSFDLTGLPPAPEQIDAFLADTSATAYERVVDRLLASTAYAERMTVDWLDLARYADSHGLHSDGWRSMYPWRDWVIRAFDDNMPYDRFLTWQLAGDLLPQPSREQLIATGFNRNHKTTAEGGAVDEEYRAEYVHDRVATAATVFMGLTLECARCHDHKYDPVSQEDYYRFYAFFNQVDDIGLTGDDGNAGPNLLLPAPATQEVLQQLKRETREVLQAILVEKQEIAEQTAFISQLSGAPVMKRRLDIHLPMDRLREGRLDGYTSVTASDGVGLVDSERGKVIELDGEYEFITVKDQGLFEQHQPFSASIWIRPTGRSETQTIVGNSGQKGTFWRGWDLLLDSLNRLSFRLIHALPHDVATVRTIDSLPVDAWSQVAFAYDGSGRASGIDLFINGEKKETAVLYDCLQRSIYPIAFSKEKVDRPLRIGRSYRAFTGEYGIFRGQLDDLRLYSRILSPLEIRELAERQSVAAALNYFRSGPEEDLRKALFQTWDALDQSDQEQQLAQLRARQISILDTVAETMIVREVEQPRPTFLLNRGNYDEPVREVTPGVPVHITWNTVSKMTDRLDLAAWLIDRDHPLTSRVAVNRFWQQFFGRGLVDTPHDFGLQGSLPSHPELLDWLAAFFMDSGWDIKNLLKQIVLSRTYRQSSFANPGLREKDPDNRLLARGPSYRLPAEMIRDNALAASGLLNPRVGGPSVKPVQPEGLWREKTSSTYLLRAYEPDSGAARYRRSLYTFVRRTSPHPAMTAFDAPNRSVCTVQRSRTNTPMQALVLLNDPQFVEASRELAERVRESCRQEEDQIRRAWRLLTGKRLEQAALLQLMQLLEEEKIRFGKDVPAAKAYLSIGQYPPRSTSDPVGLASLTVVVNTIMNLDACYTKR